MMKEFAVTSTLFGGNMPYIEALYERYLDDPAGVEPRWRDYFDALRGSAQDVAHQPVIEQFERLARSRKAAVASLDAELMNKQLGVMKLIHAYRFVGGRLADIDPLKRHEKPVLKELDLRHYGLADSDLETEFSAGVLPVGRNGRAKLREIIAMLRETYCRTVACEYMYMANEDEREWLRARIENTRLKPRLTVAEKRHLLERLTAAEGLERYLHTRYVGQKRFSGEGGDTMIPLLEHLLQKAGAAGVKETVIGMAHRGRLNVLVNVFGKRPADLFAEFEGKYDPSLLAGDVKYHMGFSSDIMTPGGPMHITLAFNPSHLEIVNPVVMGSVRARQQRRGDTTGAQVLGILLHGDGAIAGQGVVQETLALSQTRYFGTAGTVHLVINNQIAFTTSDPRDVRSSLYCTDVAKMAEVPIFHVNADDPETCLLVAEIALDYRMTFHKDVFIDLVCFRRLGHNEQDEPMVTQPLMYKKIAQHPGTRKLYADRLIAEGVVTQAEVDEMVAIYRAAMDRGENTNKYILSNYVAPYQQDWSVFKNRRWDEPCDTRVPLETLKELARKLVTLPPGFKVHPRVEKVLADRRAMGEGEQPLDWGMAENLAYASLVNQGIGVRLSGEDCGRGTFSHRHAVLHDQNRERWDAGTWIPLQHISEGQAPFWVIDSILSEEAVLGFEYGYATSEPNQLVIWEAQFGDFANCAQVVIDQFISSGEAKWGRICGLVLFLPHGYEGQGPEHSSARPERFLQLCAEHNMQVVVPSTPAQCFHMLRRQMLRKFRKPLIVFTPKSLLRHKEAVSTLEELAEGSFQCVIGETEKIVAKNVRRVIVCSGKLYYELVEYRRKHDIKDVAIIRLEQQYPFPHEDFKTQLKKFPNAQEVVWCQEEPQNQGAWYRLMAYFRADIKPEQVLLYAGRSVSASPAVGYLSWHNKQQAELVESAFSSRLGTGQMLTHL
ncbi:MAG: 2-oxoglutarate dehydrogenase E1 component [Burkholderiales bacterium]|nr:2-oxoglutarate dehydrogenase E1 component [Burkholderiales bacterium]